MSKNVKVWLNKDIEGGHYVFGTYFFNKKMGDIPAERRYSERELKFKEIESLEHKPYKNLTSMIRHKGKKLGLNVYFQS